MVSPIIVVPGLSGSVLVNKKHPTKTMFHKTIIDNRWLNIHPYSPNYMKRWKNDMKCDFNVKDQKIMGYKNINSDIQPYDLFGIDGIQNVVGDFELLGKSQQDVFHNIFNYRYFYDLNQTLLSNGHVPYETLLGFPYDFRFILDPDIRTQSFTLLKNKIEETVLKHHKRVHFICHSLGGILIKWFIEEFVNDEWVTNNISKLILINVPFGGTPSAIKAIFIGDYFVPYFNHFFVEELRINSGTIMGLPNNLAYTANDVYWYSDDLRKSYTTKSYYEDTDNIGFKLWKDLYTKSLINIGRVNHIPTTIFNSCNIETPASYWSKSYKDTPYKVITDDGDGIVSTRSLNVALDIFPNHKFVQLSKINHTQAISHPKLLEYVKKLT
jgi:hypothetical protein